MAHGDALEGKWRGNWRMEWVTSTLHTTSQHEVSSITTGDAHTSAACSRLNWHPRFFKWIRPFRRKRNLISARVPLHFNWPLRPEFFLCVVTFNLRFWMSTVNFNKKLAECEWLTKLTGYVRYAYKYTLYSYSYTYLFIVACFITNYENFVHSCYQINTEAQAVAETLDRRERRAQKHKERILSKEWHMDVKIFVSLTENMDNYLTFIL